jgi:hypothetical protein
MRKQSVSILLLLLSTFTVDLHAVLEIPLIGLFSWTAANTAATCCLCCARCEDKRETAIQDSRLNSLEKDTKRIAAVQDNQTARTILSLLAPEDSDNNFHLRAALKTSEQRIARLSEKSKKTTSQATNTDLILITPPHLSMQPRRSLDEKKPTAQPSDCQ